MRIRLTLTLDLRASKKRSEGSGPGDCESVAQGRSEARTGMGFTLPSTRYEDDE